MRRMFLGVSGLPVVCRVRPLTGALRARAVPGMPGPACWARLMWRCRPRITLPMALSAVAGHGGRRCWIRPVCIILLRRLRLWPGGRPLPGTRPIKQSVPPDSPAASRHRRGSPPSQEPPGERLPPRDGGFSAGPPPLCAHPRLVKPRRRAGA